MPTIRLATYHLGSALSVIFPSGQVADVPRIRFRCLVRLPQFLTPLDAIIDSGSPFTCFPKSIWERFVEGTDYEWMPFVAGTTVPAGHLPNWRFTFQLARFLVPLTLMDYSTMLDRVDVIAQFADSDPPPLSGNAPSTFIIGLWGGLLEGSRLAISRDPITSQVIGELEFA